MTTKGVHYHELNLDAFNIFGTKFRLKTALVLDMKKNANYYGTGQQYIEQPLTTSAADGRRTYDKFSDYQDEFLQGSGATEYENWKYNKYEYMKPTWNAFLIGKYGDSLRYGFGCTVAWTDVKSWDGRTFDIDDTTYTSNSTLLDEDRPVGYDGGWTNSLKFGVGWNRLDYQPDPKKGYLIDFTFQTQQKWVGSSYTNYRETSAIRGYYTFFKSLPLTFGGRLALTSAQGDMPFYEMNSFAFSYGAKSGLGGNRTIRGYYADRFVAKTMTLLNLEARWEFWEIAGAGQRFAFKVVGFFDAGNAYDKAYANFYDPEFKNIKYSGGGGLVIAWNQATIIHFYYSQGPEESNISIDFSHSID